MKLHDIFKKSCIFIIAAFLLSYDLSDRYLSYDEACSALLAKNILTYGYPRAYDGKNLCVAGKDGAGIYHGKDLYLSAEVTPLHYYLIAASFKLFGISTETARLPFVIIGLICVFLFGRLARKFGISANIASIYLALYVWFLIFCRFGRYYALLFLFSILLTDFYLQFFKERSKWALLKFTVTSVFFVYSHQVAAYLSLMGFFVFSIFFLKKSKKLHFILAWFLAVLSYIPWHYFVFPSQRLFPISFSLAAMVEQAWLILWVINNQVVPFVFLAILPFLFRTSTKETLTKEIVLLCILSLCIIGGVIICVPFVGGGLHRYFLGSVPLLFLLTLLILERIKHRKLMYYAILATLICTNFFHRLPTFFLFEICKIDLKNFANFTSVFSGHKPTQQTYQRLKDHTEKLRNAAKFDSHLCLYLFGELFSKYTGRQEVIIEYLQKHVKDGDTFMVREADADVLIFYLPNIRVVNRLSEKSHIKPDPTAYPIEKVKWIIPHTQHKLIALAQTNNYEKIILNHPDIPHNMINRNSPDFTEHRFRPLDYSQPKVVIYKQKGTEN